jgi:cysteine-rich repeat protein
VLPIRPFGPLTLALVLSLAASAHALCGNGILEPGETCDDGNLIPGDGCSPLCQLEVPDLPPVCTGAFASPDSLWPPNHKFVPIAIDGVTDPDGDRIAITVFDVAQDEPVDATGDGNTCGDAVGLGTDTVAVRSERSGNGDGRVYHIAFRAQDPLGLFCTGEVEVCVRHDNGHGGVCGDQGPLFDSAPAVCVSHGGGDDDDGDDDACELDRCVPPPYDIANRCDDQRLPSPITNRLNRARNLLERAAEAQRPKHQRFLARLARLQLERTGRMIPRLLDHDCEESLGNLVERAARCAACPLPFSHDD